MSKISFKDFQKIQIRTATIEEVKDHPNADRLYIMKINLGDEIKQSCAGIKPFLKKEELLGRKVVVIANLEPAEIRGEVSECMILAVDNGDQVIPVFPGDVPNGCVVR